MKKETLLEIILGTVGGLIFAIGMCMCLIPEWNLFELVVVITDIGGIALICLTTIIYINNYQGKKNINWKMVGKIAYAVLASLILGLGMTMVMVWNLMVWGLIVGVLGVIMLLFIIPMFFGFKKD